ncbi:MAG: NrfD/PsrC family molybdoenzyme membrane anchor subunit [Candidatus Kapaibacterium sp.]
MSRIQRFKSVLWAILGLGLAVGITRFIYGLGVTTNMTDNTPWGFWIGFDVMGGVALAAGGFVVAAITYIFNVKKLKPISRAAILTAFLGYLAVVIGLLFDLGLPWNIWHMIIFWNPNSPLFEVGWCVMLYLTVLFLEFLPVILEKWPGIEIFKKIYNILYKIRIPLVILGIMLSTLHQSSLGSLFLAMPYKLHPLWYSPVLPVMFFVSAICLGIMMVMVESMTSTYMYEKSPETGILDRLRRGAIFTLIFYIAFRIGDILVRGAAPFMFEASWGSFLFWVEISISVIIPLIIFIFPAKRGNVGLLYLGALLGVVGIVFNRLNVGGLTHLNNLQDIGEFYFPSWTELSVSAAVVSGAILLFFYFVENFRVWEHPPETDESPERKPKFTTHATYFGPAKAANRTRFSFYFVIAFAIGFAVISGQDIESKGVVEVKTSKARGGDTLFVDGNRDGYGVQFKHAFHEELLGEQNCQTCHHMNKPNDENTGCYECHFNMYSPGDAFRHDWHASETGAALECFDCHEENKFKSVATAKGCESCHDDLFPKNATIEVADYNADAYVDAMHTMCIGCHESSIADQPEMAARRPDLAACATCHPAGQEVQITERIFSRVKQNKWVVVPAKLDYQH